MPTVEGICLAVQQIVDNGLLQCWFWQDYFELNSGERRTFEHIFRYIWVARAGRGSGVEARPSRVGE